MDEAPRWSKNGQYLCCPVWGSIWISAADGSYQRRLEANSLNRYVRGWIQPQEEITLWTLDGPSLLTIVIDRETRRDGLAHLDLEGGESHMCQELDGFCSTYRQEVASDGSLYLAIENANRPQEIWHVKKSFSSKRFFSPNPDLDRASLGEPNLIEWDALDGQKHRGALMLPPDNPKKKKLPMILLIYPGEPLSEFVHRFGFGESDFGNAHLFASRGYAVLFPDMPLKKYDPMRQLLGLTLPAINRVIDLGIADSERIGLMGHSYGGYGVLSLLTQTDRFRAAVCFDGIANLTSYYAHGGWEWAEMIQGGMRGSLWEHREDYIENSPLFYLDRLNTPLLLISSSASDAGISMYTAQAEEAYHALRRMKKRVEWRSYKGECHDASLWSEANLKDMCNAIFDWFETFLKR